MRKKLGLTHGELETAVDRGMAACRIYRDRESIRLCQTGVVHLQRLVRTGPTFPGQIAKATSVAKGACRALAQDDFESKLCQRGVDLASGEIRKEAPGISGSRPFSPEILRRLYDTTAHYCDTRFTDPMRAAACKVGIDRMYDALRPIAGMSGRRGRR